MAYTFPTPARALFASKLLGYSFFNPIAWLFFLPFLILVYVSGGCGWMSLPLGFMVFVWILLLVGAVTTLCEVAMRKFFSLSQLKNIQAVFTVLGMASLMLVIASGVSAPLAGWLVGRVASLRALTWSPFSLPLYLGQPSATMEQIQLSVSGMIVLLFAGV